MIGDAKLTMPPSRGRRSRRQFATMGRHASARGFKMVLVLAFRTRGSIVGSWVQTLVTQQGAALSVVSAT